MQAYSLDLRERVVKAYEKGGATLVEIAGRFSVGPTFVKKMLRQKRETGSLERVPQRAGAEKGLVRHSPEVVGPASQSQAGCDSWRIARAVDAREAKEGQSVHGVSRTAGLAVAAEKKSMTAAERNPRKRAWFWRKMKQVVHNRLKFIDESGVTTRLTRRFGRAAPGERVGEAVPKNYGHSTSVVSVIGVEGVETAMVIEGAVDTLVFDAFCEQCLRPCLQAGDVVVLDNLGAHRASRIEETAHECNARVIWLPPYSPDFSRSSRCGAN